MDAIYCRYSSHGQDGGVSIEVQLAECRRIASPDAVTYIDRAVSGTTMDRPQFNRLLADAEAGRVKRVIVHKFDRFGRTGYAHGIVSDLESLGVRVVSASEGDDPLARDIQLVVAADYSRKLSERSRAGRLHRWREGRWMGGPAVPLGYALDGQHLVIDHREAAIIRAVAEAFADQRAGYRQCADMLEAAGVYPRRCTRWTPSNVKRLLRTQLLRGVRRLRDHIAIDESLRIIDEATWAKLRQVNGERRRSRLGTERVRPFTGLIRCELCGAAYVRRVSAFNGRRYPARWVCGVRQVRGICHCGNGATIREDGLLAEIAAGLADIAGDSATADRCIAGVRAALAASSDNRAVEAARREIAATEAEIGRLVDLLACGSLPRDEGVALVGPRLEARRSRLTRLNELLASGASLAATADQIEAAVRAAMGQVADLKHASPAAANATIRAYVGSMIGHSDGSVSPCMESVHSPGLMYDWQAAIRAAYWARCA